MNFNLFNLHYLVQKYTSSEVQQQRLQSFSEHELFHSENKIVILYINFLLLQVGPWSNGYQCEM